MMTKENIIENRNTRGSELAAKRLALLRREKNRL